MNKNLAALLNFAGGTTIGAALGPKLMVLMNADWSAGWALVVLAGGAIVAALGWYKSVAKQAYGAQHIGRG